MNQAQRAHEARDNGGERVAGFSGWAEPRAARTYCVHLVSGDRIEVILSAPHLDHLVEMLRHDRALVGRVTWTDDGPEHDVLIPAHRVLLITAERSEP